MLKRMALATMLSIVAVLLLAASPALAGSPRGGKTTAALAVYQNGVQTASLAAASSHEVKGSGLGSNKTVYVGLQGYFGMTAVVTDGAGNFSLAEVAPSLPGTYSYVVLVYRQGSWRIAASTTFTVT